jgi:hypothetical protein
MNLQDFMFPITERPVAINNGQNDISDWDNLQTFLTSDYKAVGGINYIRMLLF